MPSTNNQLSPEAAKLFGVPETPELQQEQMPQLEDNAPTDGFHPSFSSLIDDPTQGYQLPPPKVSEADAVQAKDEISWGEWALDQYVKGMKFSGEVLLGAQEAGAALASGAISGPAAGLAGLGGVFYEKTGLGKYLGYDDVDPAGIVAETASSLTYKPRTEEGNTVTAIVSYPFELIHEAAQYLGDITYEGTKDPLTASLVVGAVDVLAPGAVGRGAQVAGKGTISAGKAVGKGAAYLTSARARERRLQQDMADGLKEHLGDVEAVANNLKMAEEVQGRIPGLELTVAEATGSRVLAKQQEIIDAQSPALASESFTRRQQATRAVLDFIDENIPMAKETVGDIFVKTRGRFRDAIRGLDEQLVRLQEQREKLAGGIETQPNQATGARLRQIYAEEYATAKAKGKALYEQIGDAPIPFKGVFDEVDAIFANELKYYADDQIPVSFKRIQERATPFRYPTTGEVSPVELSLKEARDLRSRLQRDKAAADSGMSPDPAKSRLLGRAVEAVDNAIDTLKDNGNASVRNAYLDARDFWRDEVKGRFEQGAAKDMAYKSAWNEFKVVDEKVIDGWFAPASRTKGGVKGIQDFVKTYGENPEAWMQLRLGILTKFRDAVVKDGEISPKAAKTWVDKHRTILQEVPEIFEEIASTTKANDSLASLQTVLNGRKTNMGRIELARLLDSATPETVVREAIGSPKKMRSLKAAVRGSEMGKEALSRHIADEVLKAVVEKDVGGVMSVKSGKMLDYMGRNEATLRMGMTPQHFNDLQTAYTALALLDRTKSPTSYKGKAFGIDITDLTGSSPNTIIAQFRAKQQGRIGFPNLIGTLGASFFNRLTQKSAIALERAALYDPKVARQLAEMARVKKVTPEMDASLRTLLFDLGLAGNLAAEKGAEQQ